MISLVIISLVVAAFTPVITKKMQAKTESERTGSVNQEGEDVEMLKAKYADMFMPADSVAGKTQTTAEGGYFKCESVKTTNNVKTVTCKVKIPSDHVSIVMVGAGGGGSGAGNGYMGRLKLNTAKIVEGMHNVALNISSSSGWSAGTLYKVDPGEPEEEYIKECPKGTAEVHTISGNIFCVTKYNIRPANLEDYHFNTINPKTWFPESEAMTKEIKVDLPEGTFLRDSGGDSEYTYILNNQAPACWISSSTDCSGTAADYPACGRTVCNWWAAEKMCPEVDLGENNCSDDGVNFNKPCKGKWRFAANNEFMGPNGSNDTTTYAGTYFLYSVMPHSLYTEVHPKNKELMLNYCSAPYKY